MRQVNHDGWTGFYITHEDWETCKSNWLAASEWCKQHLGAPNRQGRWYRTNAWFMFRDSRDAIMFKLSAL